MRIGCGYDVHEFAENRSLILAGIKIPFTKGLMGHSDADVLTHSIIDALLGAAALRDIGTHFPDKDNKYKNISSLLLLQETKDILYNNGYIINNIDATIAIERPKIGRYIDEMIVNIAKTLDIDKNFINVKATSTEGLGFVGQGLGVTAYAVCTIKDKI